LSPVFRHGSLRLYLLRLLDEEPRHGYEVIRLLRDRFMGVYSPSPGTIYPRLARLEEEGLVTHDEVDGRKVYRITDAGREELRSRSDELDELEEELSASVNDIVREVREDVRQTVRSLREELTWAARETRRERQEATEAAKQEVRDAKDAARQELRDAQEAAKQARREAQEAARHERRDVQEAARQARDEARARASEHAKRARDGLLGAFGGDLSDLSALGSDAARRVHEQAQRLRDEAQRARDDARSRDDSRDRDDARDRDDVHARDDARDQDRARDRDEAGDIPAGAGARFTGDQSWAGWTGRRGWDEWARLRGRGGWASRLEVGTLRDLERVAIQFTTDLRRLAMESGTIGENVIGDLRVILDDALTRIKTEVFGPVDDEPGEPEDGDR
jgi:DNA-binding PadR family transcriptional regulator